ncbi:MAG: response regulator [Patescibacteria group bacterium]|jgi:DNA-binding response OmpR family regulator|nr:response regulator [Patescibacteria group bacterium]
MAEKIKILLIEDEEALVEVLSTKLDKEGYEVKVGFDGEEGYDMIAEFMPDMILLDIVMPKMDGYDVLEKMKENNIKIPVIIISNSGQPVEIEKTKQLGAIDHLIKTQFNPTDVITMIQRYIDGNKEIGQNTGGGDSETEKIVPEIQLPKIEDPNANKLGINVLLVEDDSFLRDISSRKLTKEGFTVFEAVDGEQAVIGASQVNPDIILLDIILPIYDGFQILEKIRASPDPKVSKTPIIMLSNLGQDNDIKRAMDMGANDYLVKAHFTTEEIVGKIKSHLGK